MATKSPDPATPWQQARLIPTSGISGPDEAERRATSALLAVMAAVREYGLLILKPLGASAGQIDAYIEVPFDLGEKRFFPDGLIRTTRGAKTWTALIEVKTGTALLEQDQVERYLEIAREQCFDAVVTISNQIAPAPGAHPVTVDRRKTRSVKLHHLSWAELLTAAVQQRVHRGVSDPDQAWILGELIRYLEHPKSGALDFSDMGQEWVSIREAVLAGTLRATDRGLAEVASRWEQLLRFSALRLGRELGAEVQPHLSRREQSDQSVRIREQSANLVNKGQFTGALKIPGAVAPLEIVADIRAGKVTVAITVPAPREGRGTTRVNWLVRQLKDAPSELRIEAVGGTARSSTSELLGKVRENPASLIVDPSMDIRTFRVVATSAMGTKRGTGRGSFIDSVLATIDGFYGTVVQQVRTWIRRAPQLPPGTETAVQRAGIDVVLPFTQHMEGEEDTPDAAPGTSDERSGSGDTSEPTVLALGGREDEPVVEWDVANERLRQERMHQPASNTDPDSDF